MRRSPLPPGSARSSRWPSVERAFKKAHPTCAACGQKGRLLWRQLDVHHIVPFHIEPRLELVESNLITLCRGLGANRKDRHHFTVGHLGDWSGSNPYVRHDAARLLAGA